MAQQSAQAVLYGHGVPPNQGNGLNPAMPTYAAQPMTSLAEHAGVVWVPAPMANQYQDTQGGFYGMMPQSNDLMLRNSPMPSDPQDSIARDVQAQDVREEFDREELLRLMNARDVLCDKIDEIDDAMRALVIGADAAGVDSDDDDDDEGALQADDLHLLAGGDPDDGPELHELVAYLNGDEDHELARIPGLGLFRGAGRGFRGIPRIRRPKFKKFRSKLKFKPKVKKPGFKRQNAKSFNKVNINKFGSKSARAKKVAKSLAQWTGQRVTSIGDSVASTMIIDAIRNPPKSHVGGDGNNEVFSGEYAALKQAKADAGVSGNGTALKLCGGASITIYPTNAGNCVVFETNYETPKGAPEVRGYVTAFSGVLSNKVLDDNSDFGMFESAKVFNGNAYIGVITNYNAPAPGCDAMYIFK